MTKLFSPYLVKETSTTVGLVDFVLAGAVAGFRTLADAMPDGTSFTYYAKSEDGLNWEIGEGSYTAGTNTLVRNIIRTSTNGGAKVDFPAGTKEVSVVEDNYTQNFVASPAYLGSDTPTNLPEAQSDSVVAIGRQASAVGSSRSVVIGDFAVTPNISDNSIALGTGAAVDGAESGVAIGMRSGCKAVASLNPRESMAFGYRATPYNRGQHSFCAGGSVSTDFTRLFKETTDATPVNMDLDANGSTAGQSIQPILDGRPKTIAFEVHVTAHNSTDNDAWYHKYNVLGHYNGTNFIQIGTTRDVNIAEGAAMTGVAVSVSISSDQLFVNVTGIAAKTIQWAATVISSAQWHSPVPGSGVI